MIWIVSFFMFLALWLVLFVHMVRLERLEVALQQTQRLVLQLEQDRLVRMPSPVASDVVAAVVNSVVAASTTTATASSTDGLVSPGGLLHRGSWNSDATRYAGYDETTKTLLLLRIDAKGYAMTPSGLPGSSLETFSRDI